MHKKLQREALNLPGEDALKDMRDIDNSPHPPLARLTPLLNTIKARIILARPIVRQIRSHLKGPRHGDHGRQSKQPRIPRSIDRPSVQRVRPCVDEQVLDVVRLEDDGRVLRVVVGAADELVVGRDVEDAAVPLALERRALGGQDALLVHQGFHGGSEEEGVACVDAPLLACEVWDGGD